MEINVSKMKLTKYIYIYKISYQCWIKSINFCFSFPHPAFWVMRMSQMPMSFTFVSRIIVLLVRIAWSALVWCSCGTLLSAAAAPVGAHWAANSTWTTPAEQYCAFCRSGQMTKSPVSLCVSSLRGDLKVVTGEANARLCWGAQSLAAINLT